MSTGSSTLYGSAANTLYSINTTTGATTLVGSPNIGYFAVVTEDGVIYAVTEDLKICTLNGSNGAATFVSKPRYTRS